jgi:ankyrin repeat protein
MPDKRKIYKYLRIASLLIIVTSVCPTFPLAREQADPAKERITAFTEAVLSGDIAEVHRLLKAGANVNVSVYDGMSPLFLASFNGHRGIVKLLLAAGAKMDAARNNATALHAASFNGHGEIVKLLLDAGAKVNLPLKRIMSAGASRTGLLNSWEAGVLERNANPGQNGYQSSNAPITLDSRDVKFMGSMTSGVIDIPMLDINPLMVLISQPLGSTPLILASENGHIEIVKLLLDADAKVSAKRYDNSNALILASQNGYTEIVKLLLDSGAKLDSRTKIGATALILASQNGHTETVKLLLDAGAKVDVSLFPPGILSRTDGLLGSVEIKAEDRPDFEYLKIVGKSTPLILAAQNGHAEIVKLLLGVGAKVNAKTSNDSTSLILAAENGYADIVKLLLDAGAIIDAWITIEEKNYTALDLAEFHGHTEIIKLLKEYGVKK